MADLKSLFRDYCAPEAGRVYKHYLCLDLGLLERREDLLAESRDLPAESPRMADATDKRRAEITAEIEQVEQEMAEATVQIVFRSLAFSDYQRLLDASMKDVDQPDGTTTRELDADKFFPALARRCFHEFRQHGEPIPDLGADEFSTLLDHLPNGEADMLFVEVRRLHIGGDDLPKSAKQSARTQRSASNSTRRTATASARG